LTGDSVFTALKRLGLKYRHETFGERNAVEGFFSRENKEVLEQVSVQELF